MKNYLVKFALKILMILIPQITPVIREELNKILSSLEEKVKETENEFDDLIVKFIKAIIIQEKVK
jgi:hypothetical protein